MPTLQYPLRTGLLGLGLLFAAAGVFAQPVPAPRTISVTGEGEVRVAPDEALLSFGIETSSKDIEEARRDSEKRVKDLLVLTEKTGIAKQYVQTEYLNIEPRYEFQGDGKTRVFLGYFTRRNVSIVLKDMNKFEELLSGALKLGVNYVGGADLRVSELRPHRDKARLMAIRAAREKAAALAGELGAKIGKPLSISEESTYSGPIFRGGLAMQNAVSEGGSGEGGSSLSPGLVPVTARISVVFELE